MADSLIWRHKLLHSLRVALFAAVIVLIHLQHQRFSSEASQSELASIDLADICRLFPNAGATQCDAEVPARSRAVCDADGNYLGYVIQTAPDSDAIIGFSGSTNILIGFSPEDTIVGTVIASSDDTRDHVRQVIEDPQFLSTWNRLTWDEVRTMPPADSVTGATLTCQAIQESVMVRLGGTRPSLRFPQELNIDEVRRLFPEAQSVSQHPTLAWQYRVADRSGQEIGAILTTSPHADSIVGYQGPTRTLCGVSTDGQVVGITISGSYDNEPYVGYVRDDAYFRSLFNDQSIDELASLDLMEAQVEGVSGATMTSLAVAEGLVEMAQVHTTTATQASPQKTSRWSGRDAGTCSVVVLGLIIGFTSWRGKRFVRTTFQMVLIAYLGLINGDMVSQAMIVGWAQSGVPWTRASGLVALTLAALTVPVLTRRNLYCTHLCPHGAVQQLVRGRLPWKVRLPRRVSRWLQLIPAILLLWCVVVPMAGLHFSLVDIEPFDAWVFHIAGWATLTVAAVGLGASLFVPMAYCRYGCPTGGLLNFLRFNGRSDQWTRRDAWAVALVTVAAILFAAA